MSMHLSNVMVLSQWSHTRYDRPCSSPQPSTSASARGALRPVTALEATDATPDAWTKQAQCYDPVEIVHSLEGRKHSMIVGALIGSAETG
jgi:hypothetical protein